jgi:hypothetical protein
MMFGDKISRRELHELDGRPSFGYAEGVTEISPVLADAIGLRRENVLQNNSFSASDGGKVAGGWMRCSPPIRPYHPV